MATTSKMTLAGEPLRVNPTEMRWNFSMKVADQAAVGGKVIQILGVRMDDITLVGRFSPDRAKGDKEVWEAAERHRLRMRDLARLSAEDSTTPPMRLTYPPRGWDFEVYITKISEVVLDVEDFSPTWNLTLFPVGEGANKVIKGIKDLYIKRLMDGIGWKQTAYNGPMTQDLVDEMLGGQNVRDYVAGETGEAFVGSANAMEGRL